MFGMRWILVFLLLPLEGVMAQNLLMNGGFEEENICTEYAKNCAPEGWISTTLTADYYFHDPAHAYEGTHFVGLAFAVEGRKERKYSRKERFVRSRLLCGLRKGATYKLTFHVRSEHRGLDSVGVLFSADDILFRKRGLTGERPRFWLGEIATENGGEWQSVTFSFEASGTEQFITIGDFREAPFYQRSQPDLGSDYYYFIDDLSLRPLAPMERVCDASIIRETEYAFDARHNMLEKLVYRYTKTPPQLEEAPPTVLVKIDTLVIPDVLFQVNSFALNSRANSLLDSFVAQTRKLTIDSLVVEGHTDSTGSVTGNEVLSRNRALSVANYLQPHFSRIIPARGWASTKPVADNRTTAGRSRNRRVEIYLYRTE